MNDLSNQNRTPDEIWHDGSKERGCRNGKDCASEQLRTNKRMTTASKSEFKAYITHGRYVELKIFLSWAWIFGKSPEPARRGEAIRRNPWRRILFFRRMYTVRLQRQWSWQRSFAQGEDECTRVQSRRATAAQYQRCVWLFDWLLQRAGPTALNPLGEELPIPGSAEPLTMLKRGFHFARNSKHTNPPWKENLMVEVQTERPMKTTSRRYLGLSRVAAALAGPSHALLSITA